MNIDLVRLNNNIVKEINIDEVYSFPKDMLSGTDLIKLDDVRIVGSIYKNSLDNVEMNINVSGTMVLPCAITLKPVDYPFDIEISGELYELANEFSENQINFQNSIDILPIIWENILIEIPMRVVSDEARSANLNMSGDGWKFITDDEEEQKSPFSELLDMIDDREVR